jgi:hemerythrin
MTITWTDDLAVGIHEIDDQHKELFDRINALIEACNQGKGRVEIGKTVAFLEEYVETHFGTEESNMVKLQYPEYAAHKQQHLLFKKNFADIKRQLEEEGPGVHIIILTNHMVIEWLRNHIRTRDKEFGAFLQGRSSA